MFWHRHRQREVFTEADWQEFERAKRNSITAKVNSATARLLANLRLKPLKISRSK